MFKKTIAALLTLCMAISMLILPAAAVSADTQDTQAVSSGNYGLMDNVQDGVILHAWNWSYNNIKANMKTIAESGYTAVQTSPVTQPKDYLWQGVAYGNVGTPNGQGGNDGNWWKVYQPVTMSICDNGNTWFGTKAEFKSMCDEAEKYGVRVIVDIVANHMGNINGWKLGAEVMHDISPQVGEFWNPAMMTNTDYWHLSSSYVHSSDGRYDVTQGCMGMPDLNTGNKKVQNMVLDLLKECIDAGADGFRFDAAKHIEVPEDDASFASDFWPTVLDGAQNYAKQKNIGHDIYFYGEILNRFDTDDNSSKIPDAYLKRMSITDNATGDNKRNDVRYGNAGSLANASYSSLTRNNASRVVLWAESHDTFMGGGSSYLATDDMIKQTWAIVGSRKDATALFFARPYSTEDLENAKRKDGNIVDEDQTQMGEIGTMIWAEPSVAEVNKFHNFFNGQSESLSSNGSTAYNERGTTGVVIAKLDGPGSVDLEAKKMKNGTYTDAVSGNTFTVANGRIKGTVASKDGIAVVYDTATTPRNTISQAGGSFTNTLALTLGLTNATSGTYQVGTDPKTTYTGTKTIIIGEGVAQGASVTVKLTATDGTKTTDAAYTFTKQAAIIDPTNPTNPTNPPVSSVCVYFDNSQTNWSEVYCYMYGGENNAENAAWPGKAMVKLENGLYVYEVPANLLNGNVMFNNNNNGQQIPAAQQPGFVLGGSTMIYQDGQWKPYTPITPPTDPEKETYMLGDVDGNNVVNTIDVLEMQKNIARSVVFTQKQILAGDIDKSKQVDVSDVLEVQKYLAKFQINSGVGEIFEM